MQVSSDSDGGFEARERAVPMHKRRRLATNGHMRTGPVTGVDLIGGMLSRRRARVASDQMCPAEALAALQEVLRSMDAESRRVAIQGLTPRVRIALLGFMEKNTERPTLAAALVSRTSTPIRRKLANHGRAANDTADALASPRKVLARRFARAARRVARALMVPARPANGQLTAQALEFLVAEATGVDPWFMADEYRQEWQCLCLEEPPSEQEHIGAHSPLDACLVIGQQVVLEGLTKAPDLNGKCGLVTSLPAGGAERYTVQLDSGGRTVLVKLENICEAT